MADTQFSKDRWMTLGQAAQRLGVHAVTLRRWADQGLVEVSYTPGGHRRFAAADVERFLARQRSAQASALHDSTWTASALEAARAKVASHRGLALFGREDRRRKRRMGRRMLDLASQYIALAEGGDAILLQTRNLARDHAQNAQQNGLSFSDALQLVMLFRDSVEEVTVQYPAGDGGQPGPATKILPRIHKWLNTVQLEIAEAYEPAAH